MTTEPIKGEGKYMHGKLKTRKNVLRRIFMVKMFDTVCIAIQRQCLRLTLYTTKVKTTICSYMLYAGVESQQCSILNDSFDDDDAYFKV